MACSTWLSAEEEAELRAQERAKLVKIQTERETWRTAILDLLMSRFRSVPRELSDRIQNCEDETQLRQLFLRATTIDAIDHM